MPLLKGAEEVTFSGPPVEMMTEMVVIETGDSELEDPVTVTTPAWLPQVFTAKSLYSGFMLVVKLQV